MIKIDKELLERTSLLARQSERKRKNHNFHEHLSDTLQRMLNAMEPETYVQPHKHEDPDKREAFVLLKGKVAVLEFDEKGNITEYVILDSTTDTYGTEIAPRIYHSVISLEEGSVVYEVKDGPYSPIDDKNFAAWAPKEGDPKAKEYLKELRKKIGL